MKWLAVVAGVLIGISLVFFASIYAASELGGEVVVLHRQSADGSMSRVRLWIVDAGEHAWVEHGDPNADWMTLLASNPVITVERNGEANEYHGVPDPESHGTYHALRRQKYGVAARYIGMVGGGDDACTSVPVRLETIRP